MHRRAVIRRAVIDALKLNPSATPVIDGQVYPATGETVPVYNVNAGDESMVEEERIMQPAGGTKWLQHRAVEFEIECRANGEEVADSLDQMALEAEQELGKDLTLGGACDKIEYSGTTAPEHTGELEKPYGLITLTYVALYRVDARDPQALED